MLRTINEKDMSQSSVMSYDAEFKSEYDLYMHVINDVISNVHQAFLEDGKDESILQDLKEMWQEKLIKSKAVDKSRPSPWSNKSGPQLASNFPNNMLNIRLSQPQQQQQKLQQQKLQKQQQPPPPPQKQQQQSVLMTISNLLAQNNIIPTRNRAPSQVVVVRNSTGPSLANHQTMLQPRPGLLPQVVASNQSPIINVVPTTATTPLQIMTQGIRPVVQPHQIQIPQRVIQIQLPRLQPPPQPTIMPIVPNVAGHWNSITNRPTATAPIVIQPQIAQLLSTNNFIRLANPLTNPIIIQRLPVNGTNLINSGLTLTSSSKLRQVDGPDVYSWDDDDDEEEDEDLRVCATYREDEEDARLEEEPQEDHNIDEIGAPTSSDIEDMMDCDNLLVCLYSKVVRKKEKFTINLKMGILNCEGKEYAFGSGNGICILGQGW